MQPVGLRRLVTDAAARFDSGACVTVSIRRRAVEAPDSRTPNPSCSTVPRGPGRPRAGQRVARVSAETKRERSACESSTLSYSGRKRGGAASGPGAARPGRSNSSRPRSSRNGAAAGAAGRTPRAGRSGRDQRRRRRGSPGRTRRGSAAPRRRSTASVTTGRPSQASAVVERDRAGLPQTPRGGTCTARGGCGTRSASAARVAIRELLGSASPQLPAGARLLGEQLAREREHRLEVDADERRPVLGVARQLARRAPADERAQRQAVVRGDQVDRAAHHDDAHDRAVDEQPRQRVRVEVRRAATTARGTG